MDDASLERTLRILAVALALVYLAFGIVGGAAFDFDVASDRPAWIGLLTSGAVLLLAGVLVAPHAPWPAVGLFATGGILGSLVLYWAIVPPLATLALIAFGVLWARRTAPA